MNIRCPHCHHPIEVVEEALFSDLSCPSCGSNFSLIGGDATIPHIPEMRKIAHFELVRQLGMGAFGSVWMARDTQLDRTVAIKIPRSDTLTGPESELFLRDARAAAQLKHPNIVGVHEVGRDRDTLYIVSDFIDGANLKEWLSGQRLSFRESAELVAKVAEALEHAHRAGVVHRDLKPGNIMMDVGGQPHVIDFGLAKRDSGEITMTIDGHVLGTPAYMSPEQAKGEAHHADARSDVYSLGVILFELLTGELPFRGEKQMLLLQIQRDEPPRLRTLNAKVPRDLETIALKCLEKEPSTRYPTAHTLGDDLQRWLEGKPIIARPIGRVARGWRWCKRNRTVASLSIAVAAALLIGTSISSYFAVEASSRAGEAEANLVEATQQRERAEAGFREARAAVDNYYTAVSENNLLNVPGLQPLRKQLLESALSYYEKFIAEHGDDRQVRAELARTYSRVGHIMYDISSREQSSASTEKAIELYKKLVSEYPNVSDYQASLAQSYNTLANVQNTTGRMTKAATSSKKAIEIYEQLTRENPNVSDYQNGLAQSYNIVGVAQKESGRKAEAETSYRKAIEIRERLTRENPTVSNYQDWLAHSYNSLGAAQEQSGRNAEAETSYKKAIEIRERLTRENPTVSVYQDGLAYSYRHLGNAQEQSGRNAEAETSYKQALEIYERLTRENPTVSNYQDGLAQSYNTLGLAQTENGRHAEAEASYKEAIEICERLTRENPTVSNYQNSRARSYNGLADVHDATGRTTEAETFYRKAFEIYERLMRENPTVSRHQAGLAQSYNGLANVQDATGRKTEAATSRKKAIEIYEQLTRENPNVSDYQNGLAQSYNIVGVAQKESGRKAEAETSYRKAIEIRERLTRENPTVSRYQVGIAVSYENLASLQLLNDRKQAATFNDKAIEIYERLTREDPTVTRYRDRLAQCFSRRGDLIAETGNWSEAVGAFVNARTTSGRAQRTALHLAFANFAAGDEDGYRSVCGEMIASEIDVARQPSHAYNVALSCVLGDHAVDDHPKVVELAERLVAAQPINPAFQTVLGGAKYRAGDTQGALVTLKRAGSAYSVAGLAAPAMRTELLVGQLQNELFLALCYRELQDHESLQKQLEKARVLIETLEKSPPKPNAQSLPWLVPFAIEIGKRELAKLTATERVEVGP